MTRPSVDIIRGLNQAATVRRIDPYLDMDWDDPTWEVVPADQRWLPCLVDGIASSTWFADLNGDDQARFAFLRLCAFFKTGIEFELLLKQGLLAYSESLEPGSDSFRFVYHEVAEEAQHSQMFGEFLGRADRQIPSQGWSAITGGSDVSFTEANRFIIDIARRDPALYFFAVLAGEEPIDWIQRQYVTAAVTEIHPLLERLCRVHMADEARHLVFARCVIRDTVAELESKQRRQLTYALPHLLSQMTRRMLDTPTWLLDEFSVPSSVFDEPSVRRGDEQLRERCVARIVTLVESIGLLPDRLRPQWAKLGLLATEGQR